MSREDNVGPRCRLRAKARDPNVAPGFARGTRGAFRRGREGGRSKHVFVAAAFAAASARRSAYPGQSPGPHLYSAPSRAKTSSFGKIERGLGSTRRDFTRIGVMSGDWA